MEYVPKSWLSWVPSSRKIIKDFHNDIFLWLLVFVVLVAIYSGLETKWAERNMSKTYRNTILAATILGWIAALPMRWLKKKAKIVKKAKKSNKAE